MQSTEEDQWKLRNGVGKGERTYFSIFTDTSSDRILPILNEFSKAVIEAYISILQIKNYQYRLKKERIIRLIEQYDLNMLRLLLQLDYKRSLIRFLASYDHYLDLFNSRTELLDFLIFFYYEAIMEGNIIGDREFLDNFINVTQNNNSCMQKLLKVKV